MRKQADEFNRCVIRRLDQTLQFNDFDPKYNLTANTTIIKDCICASSTTILPLMPIISTSSFINNKTEVNKEQNDLKQKHFLNNQDNDLKNDLLNNISLSNNYLTTKNNTILINDEENFNLKELSLCKKNLKNNYNNYFDSINKCLLNDLTINNEIKLFDQNNVEKNKIANIKDTDDKIRDADAVYL